MAKIALRQDRITRIISVAWGSSLVVGVFVRVQSHQTVTQDFAFPPVPVIPTLNIQMVVRNRPNIEPLQSINFKDPDSGPPPPPPIVDELTKEIYAFYDAWTIPEPTHDPHTTELPGHPEQTGWYVAPDPLGPVVILPDSYKNLVGDLQPFATVADANIAIENFRSAEPGWSTVSFIITFLSFDEFGIFQQEDDQAFHFFKLNKLIPNGPTPPDPNADPDIVEFVIHNPDPVTTDTPANDPSYMMSYQVALFKTKRDKDKITLEPLDAKSILRPKVSDDDTGTTPLREITTLVRIDKKHKTIELTPSDNGPVDDDFDPPPPDPAP